MSAPRIPEMLEDSCFMVANKEKLWWLKERRSGWQFGEMGLLDALLEKIDPKDDFTFAEVGAGNGTPELPLTCQRLIDRGWSGELYEMNPESCSKLRDNFKGNPKITVVEGKVTSLQTVPHRRVYVIDVDSIDWYPFTSLIMNEQAIPSLVIVEHYPLDALCGMGTVLPNPLTCGTAPAYSGGCVVQATCRALEAIARPTYVLLCATKVNSFFLRSDLVDLFI